MVRTCEKIGGRILRFLHEVYKPRKTKEVHKGTIEKEEYSRKNNISSVGK